MFKTRTYEIDNRIYPVVYGSTHKRFIVVETFKYPWRFLTVDTKYSCFVEDEHNMYLSLAKSDARRLNTFAKAGCTFRWEPENV
jgi:hypothetical protein